jgi:hypothetical protein
MPNRLSERLFRLISHIGRFFAGDFAADRLPLGLELDFEAAVALETDIASSREKRDLK